MQKPKIKKMLKNYSNKKTPQVSEIQSKKLRPVDNNLSPNTPPIEFFNMFCNGDLNDAIVYQSNLYDTQCPVFGYQLPTNKRSSSEKSVRSVKPVSKAEINFFWEQFFLWEFVNIQIDICIGIKTPMFHSFLKP